MIFCLFPGIMSFIKPSYALLPTLMACWVAVEAHLRQHGITPPDSICFICGKYGKILRECLYNYNVYTIPTCSLETKRHFCIFLSDAWSEHSEPVKNMFLCWEYIETGFGSSVLKRYIFLRLWTRMFHLVDPSWSITVNLRTKTISRVSMATRAWEPGMRIQPWEPIRSTWHHVTGVYSM